MNIIKSYLNNLLFSYSTLLFLKSRLLGLILLLTTFLNPTIATTGLIAWATTFIFSSFVGLKKNDEIASIFTYNSLLVGFGIGAIFKITYLSIIMTIGSSILTVLLTYTLFSIFATYLKLPVLNIPFALVSMLVALASVRYSALILDSFNSLNFLNLKFLPLSIHGLLSNIGVLIFLPYDIPGLIVLISLLFLSRITFGLAVFSYFIGTLILAIFKSSFTIAFSEFYAFNFILTGIAIGGIFLIPSKRSYILAMIGVIISVFILDAVSIFWSRFGIPIFTLPFNLIVLLFVYVLNSLDHERINRLIKATPEKSLIHHYNFQERFDFLLPKPFLPFNGFWNVYQAFDGEWTHKGKWKFAYDFNIVDNETSYKNEGLFLEDYYCFNKPIVCPISGYVVDCFDNYEDNQIGNVDKIHNWGNFVIIYSNFGYYTEISHLKKKSLKVKIGDQVEIGQIIASCGNSGYSPEPHIHFQIQYLQVIGSTSFKFKIPNAITKSKNFVNDGILKKNDEVSNYHFSRILYHKLQFILDDILVYQIKKGDKILKRMVLIVKMDFDGSYYFWEQATNAKLYFGTKDSCFVLYTLESQNKTYLSYIFKSIPKIPITDQGELFWEEALPLNVVPNRKPLWISSIDKKALVAKGKYHKKDEKIYGEIKVGNSIIHTEASINQQKGFDYFRVEENKTVIEFSLIEKNN